MSEGVITYEVRSQESGVRSQQLGELRSYSEPIEHSTFNIQNKEHTLVVSPDHAFKYISIAAPYLELIEEMTAMEFLNFHQKFKPLLQDYTIQQVVSIVGLENAAQKQIRYYSSGMKQRIKLAQAIFSDTPVVLLDEPCTNLDLEGIQLYLRLINEHCKERLVIVSSNDIQEYEFCEDKISILDYK